MRRARFFLFVVLAIVGVGCGASTGRQAMSTAPTTTDDREDFSMRLVLADSTPPCDPASAALPLTQAGAVISCLSVGEATVTGDDVEYVDMSADNAISVNIRLTADGARQLDDLFAGHLGDRVAMVWHSVVIAAVVVWEPSVDGQISIDAMDLADAQRLVGELGGDPSDVPVMTPEDEESERVFNICSQHGPAESEPQGVILVSSTTAGEITELAQRVLGHPIQPWAALAPDHLVAICSYGFGPIEPNSPTTVCPNGDVIDLSVPKRYLGDEDGRWTDDPTSNSGMADVDQCG